VCRFLSGQISAYALATMSQSSLQYEEPIFFFSLPVYVAIPIPFCHAMVYCTVQRGVLSISILAFLFAVKNVSNFCITFS